MRFIAVIALLFFLLTPAAIFGQARSRIQFPQPLNTLPPQTGGFSAAPNPGAFGTTPGAFLGQSIQPFDPYALPGNLPPSTAIPPAALGFPDFATTPPGFPSNTPIQQGFGPNWQPPGTSGVFPPSFGNNGSQPNFQPPDFGAPYGSPSPRSRPMGAPPPAYQDPYYRGSPYASVPNYNHEIQPGNRPPFQRLFQDTGLRGTYLHGRRDDDLSLTEVEASTTAFLANFLGVPNGLRVTPGFAFHWTDGPQGIGYPDVPARLYSGYLDFGLEPRFNQQVSAELSARVGVYSDFQAFNEDSLRFLGTAVGVFQTTPTVALKLGVAYIDRVKIKLLPAAGILWTPNPQTRWDIFFPAPKLANYWTTIGNQQVWWYVGGEYGGGSWSVERENQPPRTDRIDINDIRLYAGVEWWNVNRYYGFAEVGYVFDRELTFFRVPGDSIDLDDTFMVRAGISW